MNDQWTRFLLSVVGFTSVRELAQEDSSNNSKREVRNITGCLTKSGGGNEYLLTGNDGSALKIRENNSVDLASNVNQPVSTGVAKRKGERGHM